MTERAVNVLGFYVEDAPGSPRGIRIVLVQPHVEEKYVEHAVETEAELWAAFTAIMEDPDLPEPDHAIDTQGNDGDGDLYGFACEQAEGMVSDMAGPVLRRIAGAVMRNPGIGLKVLRRISRNGGKR